MLISFKSLNIRDKIIELARFMNIYDSSTVKLTTNLLDFGRF
jgi:hypothetical protein